jgi:hypothetical protein
MKVSPHCIMQYFDPEIQTKTKQASSPSFKNKIAA